MDSFPICTLRELLIVINDLGLEHGTTSNTSPPKQTKDRGQKSHIPSVTTVPRETVMPSGDSQAHRKPSASTDGTGVNPVSSPAAVQTPREEEDEEQARTPKSGVNSKSDPEGEREEPVHLLFRQGSSVALPPTLAWRREWYYILY